MNKLSRAQLDRLTQHIQQTKPHEALQAELVDHIASQIEQRMDQGYDFSTAFEQVMQQANPQALDQLKQVYLQEFGIRHSQLTSTPLRVGIRSKRRPDTKPFRYMLLSSVLTFLILMVFLIVVSRPLSIPIDAFQTAWKAGLAGLVGVFIVRWWLARRLRKPKRLQTV
ncbi:SoxR reducing system RseC family protein [Spirosoma agri]|uniref:SoxR reducing system RseC family protein n=1 Tax=Spirosoma agri TaxID=1987381 RepID=A0A6M0IGZ7_9BACT|nr:SoxR reducing system RseC family protein [Spirosoma agri]NEU67478.1 SoxR reducing system RseC family protein [Spirosoma agri]